MGVACSLGLSSPLPTFLWMGWSPSSGPLHPVAFSGGLLHEWGSFPSDSGRLSSLPGQARPVVGSLDSRALSPALASPGRSLRTPTPSPLTSHPSLLRPQPSALTHHRHPSTVTPTPQPSPLTHTLTPHPHPSPLIHTLTPQWP